MLEVEVLVCKGFCPVDRGAAGAVAVQKIPTLDHEVLDLPHSQMGFWLDGLS